MDIKKLIAKAEKRNKARLLKAGYDQEYVNQVKYKTALSPRYKTGLFVGSNVWFNPVEISAKSYDWWYFVKKIGDKVVFNDYRYSPTTGKHQSKVKTLMRQLGFKIDVVIECPQGLQNLESGIEYYNNLINELQAAIDRPGSRKATNKERQKMIKLYFDKISEIERLMQA